MLEQLITFVKAQNIPVELSIKIGCACTELAPPVASASEKLIQENGEDLNQENNQNLQTEN